MTFHDNVHGNTAIIEAVSILPYRGAANRKKGYRVTYKADYDGGFVYRVSVFESLEDVRADIRRCAFDI